MRYKKLLTLLLLLPITGYAACSSYLIGFKGTNAAFDTDAFNSYSSKIESCSRVYEWQQVDDARMFIDKLDVPYTLYGFSKGAESIINLVPKVKHLPKYIITIGAWHTVNVNFTKYNVKFDNYFDYSGGKQKSPGVHVTGVKHMEMQRYVNDHMPQ